MEKDTYVVVQWPDIQELMDENWFEECILINDEQGLERYGSSAYFVPIEKYKQFYK